jgi:hypothetical protein
MCRQLRPGTKFSKQINTPHSTTAQSNMDTQESYDLTDAFADYEAALKRTAEKKLRGTQTVSRYARKRNAHELKRIRNIKIHILNSVADAASENNRGEKSDYLAVSRDQRRVPRSGRPC